MSTKKTTAKKVKKPDAKKVKAKKTVKKDVCGLKKKKLEPLKVRRLMAENKKISEMADHNFYKAENLAGELRRAERRYEVLKKTVDIYVKAARDLVEVSSNETPEHFDGIWKKVFEQAQKDGAQAQKKDHRICGGGC
jgi:hypothetical protein